MKSTFFRLPVGSGLRSCLCIFFFVLCSAASLPAAAVIRYVSAGGTGTGDSWQASSGDLQHIINESQAGDTIWVSWGHYHPNRPAYDLQTIDLLNRNNAFVLKSGLRIYGGFQGWEQSLEERNWLQYPTVLCGDLSGNDGIGFGGNAENCYHVVISAGVDSSTLLDGFVIRGGKGMTSLDSISVNGFTLHTNRGAGWVNIDGSPCLQHLFIEENYNSNGNGGACYTYSGNPVLEACVIRSNQALNGSGIYFMQGQATVANSVVYGNYASFSGGGMFNNAAAGHLYNVTIAGNRQGTLSNGTGWHSAAPAGNFLWRNVVLWGNASGVSQTGGQIDMAHCIVQGMAPGVNVWDINPRFVNQIAYSAAPTSEGDYRLMSCSPGINLGDVTGIPAEFLQLDLAGVGRIFDAVIDLGSYEYAATPWVTNFDTLSVVICEGQSYQFNSIDYDATGMYKDTFMAASGCDSAVTLNLSVVPFKSHHIYDTICYGQIYLFGGNEYISSQSGLSDTVSGSYCDSIVTLFLTVLPVWDSLTEYSICSGDSFFYGGQWLYQSGTYVDSLLSVDGCDSVLTLVLRVVPAADTSLEASICTGDSFYFAGNYLTQSGTYFDTLVSGEGCDSVVTISLTVLPIRDTLLGASICAGDSFYFAGNYLTQSGAYSDTLASGEGCDSVVMIALTVLPIKDTLLEASICAGDSFYFAGNYQTQTGAYYDSLVSSEGCDSIVTLSLTVLPIKDTILEAGICAGDSFYFAGNYLTQSGAYYDSLVSSEGCDSIVMLSLTVLPIKDTILEAGICAGDSFYFAGNYLTQSGAYYDSLVTSEGCDSIVALSLTVLPIKDTLLEASICAGDSFYFAGNYQTQTGAYYDSLVSSEGCDSIVMLSLTVLPIKDTILEAGICAGDSFYFAGNYLTQSGAYYDSLVSSEGCDSIVALSLTVLPIKDTLLEASICAGDSFYFDGNYLTQSGTYYDTLVSGEGCDSIVRLSLTVRPIKDTMLVASICTGDSFYFAGNYLTQSGAYYDSLVSSEDCDSTVALTLTVYPSNDTFLEVNICAGNTYLFNGTILNQVGLYVDTLVSSVGCDSIVALELHIGDYITHTEYVSLCDGQSYWFGGVEYNSSQTGLTDTFSTAGCDSVVIVHLNVLPNFDTVLNERICAGAAYFFNGTNISQSGTYADTLLSVNGCDSVVTLILQIVPVTDTLLEASICAGDSFYFDGNYLTQSGTYYDSLVSGEGCDSILALALTVYSSNDTILEVNICAGNTYLFNGTILNQAGLYVDTLVSSVGCDSIVALDLQIGDYITHTEYVSLCDGQSYWFGGVEYNSSQTGLTDTFSTAGCDSVVIVHLNVLPNFDTVLNERICAGAAYFFNGTNLSQSGTYVDTLLSVNGCDSVVTLILQIVPVTDTLLEASICAGDSFYFDGNYLTQSGTYYDTLVSGEGCDSILALALTVVSVTDTLLEASICAGDSFYFAGNYLTQSGTYSDAVSGEGCDSIFTLLLTVTPIKDTMLVTSICSGDSFYFDGNYLTQSGTYYDTLVSGEGCDSILALALTVYSSNDTILEVNICAGNTYLFNGTILNQAGLYVDTLVSSVGCDSIVALELHIGDYITHTEYVSLCDGQSYWFGGVEYNSSQTGLTDTFSTAGCDSVVIVHLNVLPNFDTVLNKRICAGAAYFFNGTNLSQSGTYADTLLSVNGCDSVVTLILQIVPVTDTLLEASICAGDSFYFAGDYLTQTATYYDTLVSGEGCDSILALALTVVSVTDTLLEASICAGDSFYFAGNYLTQSGTYIDTVSGEGCDSIVTLSLTVLPIKDTLLEASICAGDSFYFAGNFLTQSGAYYDSLVSSEGCDSIVTLSLTVLPIKDTLLEASICAGDSFYFAGNFLTQSGAYYDLLVSSEGCDSIVTLLLTVLPIKDTLLEASICAGDSFYFAGNFLTQSGAYYDSLVSSEGCDSVVTLSFAVLPIKDTLLEASICAGDSFYFDGNYLTQTGTYYDSLVSVEGCDSIVTLSLTLYPPMDTVLEAIICAGDSYWFKGFMLNQSGSYFDTSTSVLGCDSVIQLDLSVLSFVYFTLVDTICFGQEYFFNGVGYSTSQYGLTDTFATNGCDSIVILSLHVLAAPELSVADTTVCGAFWYQDTQILSDTTLVDTMRNERGCDSLMLHLNVRVLPESHQFIRAELLGCRSVLFEQRLFTVDTLLRDTLFNHYGCDSAYREISIHIEQFDLNVVANPPQPYYGEVVELRAISDMDFSISAWMPSDLFPRQTFSEQQLRLTREVLVTVAGESALGCRDTASTLLRPLQFSTDIFIPNAFSPNADGLNDVFRPVFHQSRANFIAELSIYDRFGDPVYFYRGSSPSWDGTYRQGESAVEGVYFYLLYVVFPDGSKWSKTGDITLVR